MAGNETRATSLPIKITNVQFTSAHPDDVPTGLLGWIRCTLNGTIQLDGISLRRTRDGRPTLSFPARFDGAGRQHHYLKPMDDETRRGIERQVFKALSIAGRV